MNYVTTNIRISEEDYLRLKEEAAKNRKSFSAIIREKISKPGDQSAKKVAQGLLEIAEKAEKEHWGGTADLSKNHNRYFLEAYLDNKQDE